MTVKKSVLRECRLAARLTQSQVAAAAGCTEQMIYLIEHQHRLPRVDLAIRIAAAVGQPVETVFPVGLHE